MTAHIHLLAHILRREFVQSDLPCNELPNNTAHQSVKTPSNTGLDPCLRTPLAPDRSDIGFSV